MTNGEAIYFLILFFSCWFFLPLAAIRGFATFGAFAYVQIPVVVAVLWLASRVLSRRAVRSKLKMLLLVFLYVLSCFATNLAALFYEVAIHL